MAGAAEWTTHAIEQLNGPFPTASIQAQMQIPTLDTGWSLPVAESQLVYMPEINRLLISTTANGAVLALSSDNLGGGWTETTLPAMHGLSYLGNGNLLVSAGDRWLSKDYGTSWRSIATTPQLPSGDTFNRWDPLLVDKNAATGVVTRLGEGGYGVTDGKSQGYVRFSADGGVTWPTLIAPPQWAGVNEVALTRAANGDIVAACRTDYTVSPASGHPADYYDGLGVSISKDNGYTWSSVNRLYDFGRHHASMVVMPNSDLVMSYVVREGYAATLTGNPQYGIEAVVSHDNGQTWDLNHRYLLDKWVGVSSNGVAGPMSTSTVLLPNGSLLTEFGTGYRATADTAPRDLGIVQWQLNEGIVQKRDSATFAYKYEMDGEPSDKDLDGNGVKDFTKCVSSSGSATGASHGILTINGGGDGYNNRAAYYQSGVTDEIWARSGITVSMGFTVEIRLKVDSMIAGRYGAAALMTGAGDNANYLIFRDDGLTWGEKSELTYATSTTDDFHIYRIAMQDGLYSLWEDGVLLASLLAPSESYVANLLRLGDDGSSLNGVVEVDYLRLTAGAYAPAATPEPSSLTLLAMTMLGVLAYARTKRRGS